MLENLGDLEDNMLKTQGVRDLVSEVLAQLQKPYGSDIIDDVCWAIEQNPAWLARYRSLQRQMQWWVVNNAIGAHTILLTGGQTVRQVPKKRMTIMGSYTELRFP